jgi:hypothetical protein
MHFEGERKLVARDQIIVGFFYAGNGREKGYDAVEEAKGWVAKLFSAISVSFIPAYTDISGPAVWQLVQKQENEKGYHLALGQ